MNRKHLILLALALLPLAAVPALATPGSAASAAKPMEPDVPGAIAVPAGHKLFLVSRAAGVQIYSCSPTSTGYGWSFIAPRANLYNDSGKLVAAHFAGPTWQARDGSAVVAQVVDRAPVDATAIPWLLLAAASAGVGEDGDRLAGTTYIQRIATTGGLAPAPGECHAGTAGTTAEVPYTADYYFWKALGS